jgi:hypothetical protein
VCAHVSPSAERADVSEADMLARQAGDADGWKSCRSFASLTWIATWIPVGLTDGGAFSLTKPREPFVHMVLMVTMEECRPWIVGYQVVSAVE